MKPEMTQCLKANSQKMIITKTAAVVTKRIDDHSPFAVVYATVTRYLNEPSKKPQRLTLTSGQTDIGKKFLSFSMMDLTKRRALELGDSRNFEAAFDLADNRKSVEAGCEKAKLFYNEHILYNNPFPPKYKFAYVIEQSKKARKEIAKPPKTEDDVITAKSTSSSTSLLEGTMSLTSVSSHSQLSATMPSHPVNLKTPKKNSSRFRQQPPDSQMKHHPPPTQPPPPSKSSKAKSPKRGGHSDENRLMNTFNTPE